MNVDKLVRPARKIESNFSNFFFFSRFLRETRRTLTFAAIAINYRPINSSPMTRFAQKNESFYMSCRSRNNGDIILRRRTFFLSFFYTHILSRALSSHLVFKRYIIFIQPLDNVRGGGGRIYAYTGEYIVLNYLCEESS